MPRLDLPDEWRAQFDQHAIDVAHEGERLAPGLGIGGSDQDRSRRNGLRDRAVEIIDDEGGLRTDRLCIGPVATIVDLAEKTGLHQGACG